MWFQWNLGRMTNSQHWRVFFLSSWFIIKFTETHHLFPRSVNINLPTCEKVNHFCLFTSSFFNLNISVTYVTKWQRFDDQIICQRFQNELFTKKIKKNFVQCYLWSLEMYIYIYFFIKSICIKLLLFDTFSVNLALLDDYTLTTQNILVHAYSSELNELS